MRSADCSRVSCRCRVEPGPGGAVLLLYDVTELAHVDEMRSELVAVASHELQTPLTTLRMSLLMLREASDVLPARQRELVATSLIGVEQLDGDRARVPGLTRIEAGELRLNLEPVQVSAVIAEAVQRVEAQAKAQGIRLTKDIESERSLVSADPLRLRRGVRQHPLERAEVHPAGRTRDGCEPSRSG